MLKFTKEQLISKYEELLNIEIANYNLAKAELEYDEVNNNFYSVYLDRMHIYTPNLDGKTYKEVSNIISELENTYKDYKLAQFKLETSLEGAWDDEYCSRYYSFYNVLANENQTIKNAEIEELYFVLYIFDINKKFYYAMNTYINKQKIKEFKAGEIDFNTLYNFIKGKENG